MQIHDVDGHEFTIIGDKAITEASSLGIAPGGWPDALRIDGVIVTRQRDVRSAGDRALEAVVYRCPRHLRAVEVHILND